MSIISSAKEEQILEAARRVLCVNPAASVDDIAAAARVGRATVFRRYGNRAGLLEALARRAIAVTDRVAAEAAAPAGTATEALKQVMAAIVGVSEHYRFLGTAAELSGNEEVAGAYERQLSELADLVAAVKREGNIRPDLPTAWVVALIDSHIWAAGSAVGKGAIGLLQAQELMWDTVMAGIATESARESVNVS